MRSIDELLHYMPTVARCENDWARSFAISILRQSKRQGWRPSPKQAAMMNRLVTELFVGDDTDVVIEG